MSPLATFDNIQSLIERVNQAPTPAFCARVVVNWLVQHVGTSAIVLLREEHSPDFVLHDTVQPDVGTIARLQTDNSWQTLLTADVLQDDLTMIFPIRQQGEIYGALWQRFPDEETKSRHLNTVLMLVGMVTTRLHHLARLDKGKGDTSEMEAVLAR